MVQSLHVPGSVRLDILHLSFTSSFAVDEARSGLTFAGEQGNRESVSVAVNELLRFRGVRIYQTNDYGDSFVVRFREPGGTIRMERLLIPIPPNPDTGGYNDFRLPWLRFDLSTKYYADAERKSMSGTPLLVMRLMDGGREVSRISLKPGETGMLGPLEAHLVDTRKWAGFLFVKISGMPAIFVGFFVMVLGGALNYLTPPREVIVRKTGNGSSILWRATRFPEFYEDEHAAILKELQKEHVT